MKNKFVLVLATILLTLITSTCVKLDVDDVDRVSIDTQLALPIGVFNATMTDVVNCLNTGLRVEEASNIVYLAAGEETRVFDFDVRDLSTGKANTMTVNLKAKINSLIPSAVTSIEYTLPAGEYEVTENLSYGFFYDTEDADGVIEVDSIFAHSAKLTAAFEPLEIALDPNNYIVANLTFPDIDFAQTFAINQKIVEDKYTQMRTTPAFGVGLPTRENRTPAVLKLKIVSDGTLKIKTNSVLEVFIQFTEVDAYAAVGYAFKNDPFYDNDFVNNVTSGKFLKDLMKNDLVFTYPQIYYNVKSTIGVPMIFGVSNLSVTDTEGVQSNVSVTDASAKSVEVNLPQYRGQEANTELIFSTANSNVHELLNPVPKSFAYNCKLTSTDRSRQHTHFFTLPSAVEVQTMVRYPIAFDPGADYVYNDTIDADLQDLFSAEEVEDYTEYGELSFFTLYLDFTNKLPFRVEAELKAIDEDKNVVYTKEGIDVASAPITAEGYADGKTESLVKIVIEGEDAVNKFLSTKKLVLVMHVKNATDADYSILREQDILNVKVSATLKGRIKYEFNRDN